LCDGIQIPRADDELIPQIWRSILPITDSPSAWNVREKPMPHSNNTPWDSLRRIEPRTVADNLRMRTPRKSESTRTVNLLTTVGVDSNVSTRGPDFNLPARPERSCEV